MIDHKGNFYSIATDDEDRFDFIIKELKKALRQELPDTVSYYEALLKQEFEQCRMIV